MSLIQITDRTEQAKVMCELHKRWKPTMQVSVWGRGKATRVNKDACPDEELVGKAQYRGDCDDCAFFMGAKFKGGPHYWGDYAEGCCGLELEASLNVEGK